MATPTTINPQNIQFRAPQKRLTTSVVFEMTFVGAVAARAVSDAANMLIVPNNIFILFILRIYELTPNTFCISLATLPARRITANPIAARSEERRVGKE